MSARRTGSVFVAVAGPTGSGKSELALAIAERFDGEIVSCDALQVYRGLDIGTAKLDEASRRVVPHHLIDVVAPTATFSAARYVSLASESIRDIEGRGRLPVVVGGTGLYLRALRHGLFEGPGRVPELRERLHDIQKRRAPGVLHRLLRRLDRVSAERIHPNDTVRVVRALEVCLSTGRPMSSLMEERRAPLPGFRDILVALAPDRERLARRVERRVAWMFEQGLLEEVAGLIERYGEDLDAFKAIGYRECVRVLRGELDEASAREEITHATLAYAKRQMTWFRRERDVRWFRGVGDDASVREDVITMLGRELPDSGPAGASGRARSRASGNPGPKMETAHAETTS